MSGEAAPPRGLLIVRVLRGVNLVNRDATGSDPYVLLHLDNQRVKTRVIKKTVNPVWNEELTLNINNPSTPIKLEVFDKDTFSKDDRMGDAEVEVEALLQMARMDLEDIGSGTVVRTVRPSRQPQCCLADESRIVWQDGHLLQDLLLRLRNVATGIIHLHLKWVPIPGMDGLVGLLKVRIVRGINLAYRDARGSDPYVVLRLGKQKLKTSVKKKSVNPIWHEELTLSVTSPNAKIKLGVFDKDTFSRDDPMGEAEIEVEHLMEAASMDPESIRDGAVLRSVPASRHNCLAEESHVCWRNGLFVQEMILRLNNVESGELQLQLTWMKLPGAK